MEDRSNDSETGGEESPEPDISYSDSSEEQIYGVNCDSSADEFSETNGPNSNSSPRKRHRSSPQTSSESNPDRISTLPDSILLQILSLLSMKTIVSTSVLSRRWIYLWTGVPSLAFHHHGAWDEGKREKFVSFVHKTLALYGSSSIRKFLVDFQYKEYFESHVNCWVRFATLKHVEELELCFYNECDVFDILDIEFYALPQHLYTNSSIKRLSLRYCDVMPYGDISWRSLKSLSIRLVELTNDLIHNIISGSPVLEFLELQRCRGFSRINIASTSLKRLVINDHLNPLNLDAVEDMGLKLSAPNLDTLELIGGFHGIRVENLSSLTRANLGFSLSRVTDGLDNFEACARMLIEVFDNVCHVEELTVGSWCIKVFSICEKKALSSRLSKCRCLTLKTSFIKWDFPGIASLLESSPDLEILVMKLSPYNGTTVWFANRFYAANDFDEGQYWTSQKKNLKCLEERLKIVEIAGLVACWGDDKILFMQFLLKNALLLEKVTINAQRLQLRAEKPQALLEIAQRLLSLPRSSSSAEVVLNDTQEFIPIDSY